MSFFIVKSLLGILFLAAGVTAVICMLTLMGRMERKTSTSVLRRLHRSAGLFFGILLLAISYFCIKYWIAAGDKVSTRATFHAVLALALIILFLLKISIVRFYKQFLRFVPAMGLTVFALAFLVFSTSAGFYLLKEAWANPEIPKIAPGEPGTPANIRGDAEKGRSLFAAKCAGCHHTDRSKESKVGPGLKNVLKKPKLPASGKPATAENIVSQLRKPFRSMPSFSYLTAQEVADLLAFITGL
ncbi:MAG: c-type cytochrome [Candidatus Aminicenantes bacterium]